MLTLSFEYTNKQQQSSKRVLVAHVTPNTMYAGTDISELDPETQVLYISELNKVQSVYLQEIEKLNTRYDLKYRYRQFKPELMTNVVKEQI